MNQVTIQWGVVTAFYILFNWCHGGITTLRCSGHIWVEPATVFKMGMNISIYCQAAIKNCQPRRVFFYKNDEERFQATMINKTTAWLWYSNFREPRVSVYCTAECLEYFQETLICGKDISSGYPPDVPANVTCVIHEYSGNMTCTWNIGKPTYLDTKYTVRVKSLETEEEQQYLTFSSINISTDALQGAKKYVVWVQAANVLGMEESEQLKIHLDDIVIPSSATISRAENINTTATRTIIHWTSQTAIEKVSCEMRYKVTTNETWHVKEIDANFTYLQRSEFYLEPNTKYVFQVRCQKTGSRYWQFWSSPFFHTTPKTVLQVKFQHETQNSGLLFTSKHKGHLITDNKRQNIGLLSGMLCFAFMLSILSLIVIFNRSLQTGIKRRILLLIPKWLHEDIPNIENSKVFKILQDKSEFVTNNPSEQVLYTDPMITEIREVFFPEAHTLTDNNKGSQTGPQEMRDCLQESLLTNTTVVYIPDLNTGYKPQISNSLPGENPLSNNNETDSSILKTPVGSLDLGKNAISKKYPSFAVSVSSMNSLGNTLCLEELSLILNQGECNPHDRQNSIEGETTILLGNTSPNETIPDQTLLPDEFVSCLGIMNEELPSINPYFPQSILEEHFNRKNKSA
ncbi:PREDICTED: interleukin-23 receptor [Chrysochloris asiatica]|uniref:Interleukin-23 receptor n=1 Tax=Chrysochloris asiatica TaxID=185453 RepID=A0A9B0THC4_CHRAS|nr:PREDICTED: interleukin-23 receptor [Chrysochloris asiatica]